MSTDDLTVHVRGYRRFGRMTVTVELDDPNSEGALLYIRSPSRGHFRLQQDISDLYRSNPQTALAFAADLRDSLACALKATDLQLACCEEACKKANDKLDRIQEILGPCRDEFDHDY